ncbi:MAG TPA: type II toxin-antitoxin system RelE/ParE family toxin [Caulobacteraceae bacterium]
MRSYSVRFTAAALDDLTSIFDFVSEKAGARVAEGFVLHLEAACLSLDVAPLRGTARDDLRAGLRTFGVDRRATIAFTVDEARGEAVILGVFYGGRDIEAALTRRR